MKNVIAARISDFLIKHPPFNAIPFFEMVTISSHVEVLYFDKNDIIFQTGDPTHHFFYVVKDGAIGLSVSNDTDEMLIDKCDEGDILGLRPFFAKNNYLMTARATEESLVYAIPIEIFRPYVLKYQAVAIFLLESFASNTRNPYDKENKGKLISENVIYNDQSSEIHYFQPIPYTKAPFTALADDTVQSVAMAMSQLKIGSVIITDNNLPVGIITDKDLRTKIATGCFPISVSAKTIMSAPVVTVSDKISIAETQLMMLKNNIGHLCVTLDGTADSSIIGVISEHDIIVSQANNPGVLLKQVKRAEDDTALKEVREKLSLLVKNSVSKSAPITHLASIVTEINNAIIKRAIALAIARMELAPPARFAWINIGSQGRKEQLLITDQDNALIFEDIPDVIKRDFAKHYFLKLAEHVTQILNTVGFEYCPANMMASNPLWCKSIEEWLAQFNSWIHKPGDKGMMMCSIFFDYDLVYGDEKLIQPITEYIHKNTQDNHLFFAYMGTDALKNPPPLGFFRQFLVESDGAHKDTFDIKTRAMLPLADAARLLSLHYQVKGMTNTIGRFKRLGEIEPQNKDFFDNCADAYGLLMFFRLQQGIKNNNSGKYIDLKLLSKFDKVKLKNSFEPIRDIQDMIKNRFKLTYFT
jgi:CBS domain-containing protein